MGLPLLVPLAQLGALELLPFPLMGPWDQHGRQSLKGFLLSGAGLDDVDRAKASKRVRLEGGFWRDVIAR